MKKSTAEKAATILFKINSLRRSIEQVEALKDADLRGITLNFKVDAMAHEMHISGGVIDRESMIGYMNLHLKQELLNAEKELSELNDEDSLYEESKTIETTVEDETKVIND